MTAIPFPISSAPGMQAQEGGGRLINCYAEKTGEAARFPVIWRRCGGLRQLAVTADHVHLRGAILEASTVLLAFNSRVYSLTESGGVYTLTNLGSLAGTKPVTMAKNNAATPNIACVTENGAFNLFTGSSPSSFADTDLPVPNSVCHLDGYLIFSIGDGRIFATDLNAVTVSSSSYTTEQGLALRRVVAFRSEVYAMGDKWIGVYRDAGTAPFPLERRFTIPRGICGTHAVAGWEPGWANELIWVGDDSIVYRLNGYTPEPVSTPDVVRDIEAAGEDRELFEAMVYMDGGHAFWALTSPGNWTWVYNQTTGNWIERKSFNTNDWRASASLRAFNQWIVGDEATGKVFAIDPDIKNEGDDPLQMIIRSGCAANFPNRVALPGAYFDFTAGQGVASGEDDPQVQVRWSLDGGASFGSPVLRDLGEQGEYSRKVQVNRLGMTRGKGVVFELMVSDQVHVGFMGGQFMGEVRAP